ncbi:AAA family ATPase [Candidatus Aerophobetes bacterium]|nr:AAA family ATPase [Candidatus Aerophobetes bacterium]
MSFHKRVFVAATRQDDGKSTVCLGLLQVLKKEYSRVGFMKPVGQHYVEQDGVKVDEDVVLMREVCGVNNNLKDMNPITVAKGFTERYLVEGGLEKYIKMIEDSYERISRNKDLMLIEGTGHAGVGAVFDLCNASVAKLLKCKVILVSTGGIGKPIDEVIINKALFDQEKVEIIGVVLNKVIAEKYEKIKKITKIGFERKGIKLLGVIPFKQCLTYPTMEQILEAITGKVIYGGKFLQKKVLRVLVGAMEPYHALSYFAPCSLIIVPGDREDIILAAIAGERVMGKDYEIAGIILTGNLLPHEGVMRLLKESQFPILISEDDTYITTKKVHECRVKIRAKDEDKVKEAARLMETYLDIDEIVNSI